MLLKKLSIDPNYAEAHATKAEIEYYYKNFDGMLQAGEKAIELAPNDAFVLVEYLIYLHYLVGGVII